MSEEKNVDLQEKEVNEVPSTEEKEDKETEEVKNETVENTEASEVTEENTEETNEENANAPVEEPFQDLAKPEFEDCEEYVRKMKAEFDKNLAKDRNSSMITIVVVLVLFVAIFAGSFFMPKDYSWVITLLFALVIVGVIVYMIFLFKGRKKLDKVVQKFLLDFIYGVDAYAFATNDKLNDVKASKAAKVTIDEIVDAHYFDVINAFNTRNVVKANFLDKEIRCGELACRVPVVKEVKLDEEGNVIEQPVNPKDPTETYGIFGKYFSYECEADHEDAFIVYMEGPNAYKPTFLDGYEEIEVEGLRSDFHCYAVNKERALKKLMNIRFILNEFTPDDVLENLFVSYNEKGLKVCLNYNETLMEVPLRKDIKNKPYAHFKDDINGVLGIAECLTKDVCLKVEREFKPQVETLEQPKEENKEEAPVTEAKEETSEKKEDQE